MKKLMIMVLLAVAAGCVQAYAFENDGSPAALEKTRRIEVKKIKDAQRQARLNESKAPAKSGEPDFWAKEGERSGFAQTGDRFGTFIANLNPVPFFSTQQEAYEARKAAKLAQQKAAK